MPQAVRVVVGREPEGRVDPLNQREVIISAARSMREGKRKPDFVYTTEEMPSLQDDCPFCPGHESNTPPELIAFRPHRGNEATWTTRGFTNLYPILALEANGHGNPNPGENLALGVNEVIVETRRHNGFLSSLSVGEISQAFEAVISRYFSLRGDHRLEWFSLFKNFGRSAGASVEHPHLQIAVKSRVPRKFRGRYLHAQEYFWNKRSCIYCDEIRRHRELGQIVFETAHFVVLVPHAAIVPYHLRIFPKTHNPSFAHVLRDSVAMRDDFALALKNTILLFKIAVQGDDFEKYSDPMYNFYIETAPYREDHKEGVLHWWLEFIGRTTIEAGYEKHTGEHVNPTYPEEVANQLKEIAATYLNLRNLSIRR